LLYCAGADLETALGAVHLVAALEACLDRGRANGLVNGESRLQPINCLTEDHMPTSIRTIFNNKFK
jgi:hypothetical protein